MPESVHFSPEELSALRSHGVVLFAQRVIFDAQPPLSPPQAQALEQRCAGLPADLLGLWSQCAGGRLDYDLRLSLGRYDEALHWTDLLAPPQAPDATGEMNDWAGSSAWSAPPPDLLHDGAPAPRRRSYVALGGSANEEALYTVVDPGHPAHGSVLVWRKALTIHGLHHPYEDSVSTIASSVEGAFATLHLEEDPLQPAGNASTGLALQAYLDERHSDHALPLALADKLMAYYRGALSDWRGPLAAGTLARHHELAHIALRHAVHTDNAALVHALSRCGVALHVPVDGDANAVDLAIRRSAWKAAHALLDEDVPVAADALKEIDSALAPELTARLLAAGAQPHAEAMAQCVACGAPASARLIGSMMLARGSDMTQRFDSARQSLLSELQDELQRVHSGQLSHYLGTEGLMERAEHLRDFVW